MTIRNLERLFRPKSVAIIGASAKQGSVGGTVLRNMISGGFSGPVFAVNPKYKDVQGRDCYARVGDLPQCPELAVICTPADTVPGLIAELGAIGCKAAVVLSAGFSGPDHKALRQALLDSARPHLLRVLGPNCIGLLAPGIGLNASFAPAAATPGRLAFVTQSGALATAVLDWAKARGIGFSHFVSLGDSADVDVSDVIDFLSCHGDTRAILLYIEGVEAGRKFLSAARAAARSMPVVVVKAGRVPAAARAATSHTGAMAGSDMVYEAVFRRAGMLRVDTTEELFNAVETLARAPAPCGDRLAILTNGGGPGVMAADSVALRGGQLAQLSSRTIVELDEVLPETWSRGNPVDIVGDAPVERYLKAMHILQDCRDNDAILLLHAPTAIVDSADIAVGVVGQSVRSKKPLLTAWLGGTAVAGARKICRDSSIPAYDTPEDAISGWLQIVEFQRNQAMLLEAPPWEEELGVDVEAAKKVIYESMHAGRYTLTEPESKAVLAAFGIPIIETLVTTTVEEAVRAADSIGYPVVLKILSPDITHKSDVGGVALDLLTEQALRAAANQMKAWVMKEVPAARLEGFSVQKMVRREGGIELIAGLSADPIFGPLVLFGHGGVAVKQIGDTALALPPLNQQLAQELVSRTRVSRLLSGFRDVAPVSMDALLSVLVALSRMACELGSITEIDINPLLAHADGVVALDARIVLKRNGDDPRGRLVILPYPDELSREVLWQGTKLTVRPIRPDDGHRLEAFYRRMSDDDRHARFLGGITEVNANQLARMTQIDYARAMCFIALRSSPGEAEPQIIGEGRMACDPDNDRAEIAIAVRTDSQRRGLGAMLLEMIVTYAQALGIARLDCTTRAENEALIALARSFGFELHSRSGGVMTMRRTLYPA